MERKYVFTMKPDTFENTFEEDLLNVMQKLIIHEIPDEYPSEMIRETCTPGFKSKSLLYASLDDKDNVFMNIIGRYGSWIPITNKFCEKLSDLIKSLPDQRVSNISPKPKILEVGCGNGMLTYGLRKYGIDIIATDDMSWERNKKELWVDDIEKLSYVEAFHKYKNDVNVIIMSYPPYGNLNCYKMVKEMYKYSSACREAYLLIYIGEIYGNCASDELFDFLENNSLVDIPESLNGEMKSYLGQNSEMILYVI